MARGLKYGQMAPMTNRVKVWKYSYGLNIETNNFAFDVNIILGSGK